jgi:hypothetical protein
MPLVLSGTNGISSPSIAGFAVRGISNPATGSYVTTGSATVIFSSILTNNGSYYSNVTGRFTAPFAGLYYFSTSVLIDLAATSGEVTSVAIHKNGSSTGFTAYDQNPGGRYQQTSQSCVVSLAVGDYVNVYLNSGKLHVGSESAFTGFYIG